ncbi:phage tail tape measure protein [uncultured Pontibacter sp.]|uniref:phage tail tape measure protein n=1 Tax=uncultured Pontibacter sp. TaxID=453356 RepID=UPI00262CD9EC|nr:phage tail tape measure protein [uncultured Pontibacter sp.]
MASTTEERRIKIILDGKQVNASLKEMEAAQKAMNFQLKNMSKDDPKRAELLKDFKEMRERIKNTKDEIYGMEKASATAKAGLGGITSATGLLRAGFKAAVAAFLPLLAFQTIVDLGRQFLGLVNHIDQVKGSLQQLTGVQGEALDQMYVRVEAISKTFDEEYNEVIKSANVLMKEFGLTHEEAFDLMEKGYLAGANSSGEMLEQLKEYSTQFATSGASAEEFLSVLTMGEDMGIFSDKAADTVKEFGLRIREQTVATRDAMDAAFGQEFTDKIFNGINTGAMTSFEALKEVSSEMNNTQIPAKELQTVIADVFGGAGEDAGLPFIQRLHEVNGGLENMIDTTNTLTTAQMDQLEAEKELAEAQAELGETFAGTGATLSWLWTNIQTVGLKVINAFIVSIKRIRDEAVGIGYALGSIGESIGTAWDALMDGDLSGVASAFSNMGKNASEAYYEGYLKNEMEAREDKKKMEQQENEKALKAAEGAATEKAKREAEATRAEKDKAAKKAAAEAEKQRVKEETDLRKALEAYRAAKLKAEEETERLRIMVKTEGVAQEIALLQHKHLLELAELEKQRQAVLQNIAVTEEEKQALLDMYEEQRQLKEEEYAAAKAEKEQEKQEEDLEKWFERMEEEDEIKRELIEQQFMNAMDADIQKHDALLEVDRAAAQRRLDNLVAAGKGETLAAERLRTDIMRIEKEKSDGQIELAQRTQQMKRYLEQQTFQTASAFLGLGIDLLSRDEAARKKNAGLIKAFSAAKIISDLQAEISGYMAHPASTGTLGAVGTAKVILATVRAGMALEQVRAQQFATGGNTIPMQLIGTSWQMASGYSGGSIGTFAAGGNVKSARLGLIGEAGAEWVMPNWMIRSPKYAATYQWLEGERQRGVSAFASGGNTAANVSAPPVQDNSTELLNALQVLNGNFVALSQRVDQWPTTLHVNYNAGAAQEAMEIHNTMQSKGGF